MISKCIKMHIKNKLLMNLMPTKKKSVNSKTKFVSRSYSTTNNITWNNKRKTKLSLKVTKKSSI